MRLADHAICVHAGRPSARRARRQHTGGRRQRSNTVDLRTDRTLKVGRCVPDPTGALPRRRGYVTAFSGARHGSSIRGTVTGGALSASGRRLRQVLESTVRVDRRRHHPRRGRRKLRPLRPHQLHARRVIRLRQLLQQLSRMHVVVMQPPLRLVRLALRGRRSNGRQVDHRLLDHPHIRRLGVQKRIHRRLRRRRILRHVALHLAKSDRGVVHPRARVLRVVAQSQCRVGHPGAPAAECLAALALPVDAVHVLLEVVAQFFDGGGGCCQAVGEVGDLLGVGGFDHCLELFVGDRREVVGGEGGRELAARVSRIRQRGVGQRGIGHGHSLPLPSPVVGCVAYGSVPGSYCCLTRFWISHMRARWSSSVLA